MLSILQLEAPAPYTPETEGVRPMESTGDITLANQ